VEHHRADERRPGYGRDRVEESLRRVDERANVVHVLTIAERVTGLRARLKIKT